MPFPVQCQSMDFRTGPVFLGSQPDFLKCFGHQSLAWCGFRGKGQETPCGARSLRDNLNARGSVHQLMVPPDCQTGYAASSAVTPTNVEPTEYSGAAVARSAWTTLQTLANKVASVAAMYLRARVLLPADFGLASLAVSIGAFAFVIPPYVMGDVLISAPFGFGRRSGAALMAVWAVGILPALAMIGSAWPIQQVTGKLGFAAVLCVVAARPLADALMIVPMARMRLDLMFRRISMIDSLSAHSSSVRRCGGDLRCLDAEVARSRRDWRNLAAFGGLEHGASSCGSLLRRSARHLVRRFRNRSWP